MIIIMGMIILLWIVFLIQDVSRLERKIERLGDKIDKLREELK